jgi:uncharacterized membrane protein YccC
MWLRSTAPALLFGLRLWASVCLALYLAFWLELDNAYWAGTTAAIVCQPSLGASLRKGWFRMIGTVVGAIAIVVITACFPLDRAAFLVSLALWGAACALVATLLRNFAAYSAALAGYTAAIIASDQLGAVGGLNGQAFTIAVTRATEICIGIVCAGVVLAGTDLGGAPRRLASLFAAISAEIAGRFTNTLSWAGPQPPDTQAIRRELTQRIIALDPVIDTAIGESSRLRYHSPVLQTAAYGLIATIAGWRTVSLHLMRLPDEQAHEEADLVLQRLPQVLWTEPSQGEATGWTAEPSRLRQICDTAVEALTALPARTPSLRLLADHTAEALIGISQALSGLALLVDDPARSVVGRRGVRFNVPDWLPSLVNAGRAFVTIGGVALLWIVTAWPNGTTAMTFAAVGVILFAPRADQAYATAMNFMVGVGLTAAFAAIVDFAVLPQFESFAGFCLAIGLVLLPGGALMAQAWRPIMFLAMTANFIPILAPANQMSYDTQQFYNAASAIVAGACAGAISFRLLPPLSPAFRARRLLTLTLRDLRRLATSAFQITPSDWQERVYSRLFILPDSAEPLQRSQLVAALSVGNEIIKLRGIARQMGLGSDLGAALDAVARGNSTFAIARFTELDRALASLSNLEPAASVALRARGSILAMTEALTQHSAYFDARAPG